MKNFVLDTNVLLHNSLAIFSFENNRVIIPLAVIEELDKFKTYSDEKGRHAREVARQLDRLRNKGQLYEGVPLPNGGEVQVVPGDHIELPKGLSGDKRDNFILGTALHVKAKRPGEHVCFVTKDLNARVKADALGIKSEDFESHKVNIDELYTGWRSVQVSEGVMAQFI